MVFKSVHFSWTCFDDRVWHGYNWREQYCCGEICYAFSANTSRKMIQCRSTAEIGCQLLTFLLLSFALTTSWATTDQDVFNAFIEEHRVTCPVYNTCGNGPKEVDTMNDTAEMKQKQFCCGFCSCEPVCEKYGNCCLGYFHNFSEGMSFVDGNR